MNRQEKIAYLADAIAAWCPDLPGGAEMRAKEILDHIFPPLAPIERDESYNRTYIPMLGDSEVQTKGKGSTFRIVPDDDRMPISVCSFEQEFIENMARYIRKQYGE